MGKDWQGFSGPRALRINLAHTKSEREGVLPKAHYLVVCGYAGGGVQEDWTYPGDPPRCPDRGGLLGPLFFGVLGWVCPDRAGWCRKSVDVPELDAGDEDALRVHLRERREDVWLTYAEDEDLFHARFSCGGCPGTGAVRGQGRGLRNRPASPTGALALLGLLVIMT